MSRRRTLTAGAFAVVLAGCDSAPAADAPPPDAARYTTVVDEVAVSAPGGGGTVTALATAPGGGVYVSVSDDGRTYLRTVDPRDGGFEVTGEVPVPLHYTEDMALLDDGRLVMTGWFAEHARDEVVGSDYRFPEQVLVLADPAGGGTEHVLIDWAPGDQLEDPSAGLVALSDDGRTLYVMVQNEAASTGDERQAVLAVDTASGDVVARRELAPDLAEVTPNSDRTTTLRISAGDTGVAVEVLAVPEEDEDPAGLEALLLRYTPDLEPDGPVVRKLGSPEQMHPAGMVSGSGGSVFLALSDDSGQRLVSVPAGGERTTSLAEHDLPATGVAPAVAPSGATVLLPTGTGALSVDLTSAAEDGEIVLPCLEDVGDPGTEMYVSGVTDLAIGNEYAFLAGSCGTGMHDQRLWVLAR